MSDRSALSYYTRTPIVVLFSLLEHRDLMAQVLQIRLLTCYTFGYDLVQQ